ncbi:MAG: hypothetical protein LLG04_11105 [Parachlamydia sp.]|nr:hypothetical protein [Parachlamydia sp.]
MNPNGLFLFRPNISQVSFHDMPQKYAFVQKEKKRLEGIEFYHLPARFEREQVVAKSPAPYLHAYQNAATDSRCGFFAALSFFGQPIPFSQFAAALIRFLTEEKQICSLQEAKAIVHPCEFGALNEEALNDVDIESLRGAIHHLAKNHIIPSYFTSTVLLSFDLTEHSWNHIKESLMPFLRKNDRAIVGVASPCENHLFALRKDPSDVWWKVDSLLNTQEGFKEHEIFSEIQALYGTYAQGLFFILLPEK